MKDCCCLHPTLYGFAGCCKTHKGSSHQCKILIWAPDGICEKTHGGLVMADSNTWCDDLATEAVARLEAEFLG